MKKNLLKVSALTLALALPCFSAWADKYEIYPVPHSITMNDGTLALTKKVNVQCESTIDKITRNRLASLLQAHGMEAVFGGGEEGATPLRLGTVGSGEEVETWAFGELGLAKAKIMVSNKFDRHAISISAEGITILGEHTNAVFCGLASLEQMLEQQVEGTLEHTTIYDRADQQNRGLVEGYYGYPYSVEVKKELMRYMMRYKMNTYMFGAKSDPYHSQMWKDAYPTTISAEQEKNGWLTQDMLRDLAKVSEDTKVNFIWAIHPGNEFLGSSTVISDIMSKFEKMHNLGIRHFGVFVDDVGIPSSDADMKKNADRLTELQQKIEAKWNYEGAAAEDTVRPLHFVPQIYCNSFASSVDQRQRFMSALSKVPSYITVYSTGQGVWSVPNNDHTQTVVNEFGRAMAWWWNYPCNDNADGQLYPMDMYSNFVDMPSVGAGDRLPSTLNNCQGLIANPMQQGSMARTALFSIADYAWNNAGFKNEQSWEASFKSLIKDEEMRQAYHDITYYLRWNEPDKMKNLITSYKNSLNSGKPNSTNILSVIQKIKQDCEKVMTMKDSENASDRMLYTDINPWLQTLHTYAIVTENMVKILDAPEEHAQNWPLVKEVCDSLYALENSTLYTAYALEGMGNGISVSYRQAQLSRLYLYPFISFLKERTVDTYFKDYTTISKPTAISNSPLLKATVAQKGSKIFLNMPTSNLDVNKYVGIQLVEPILLDNINITEDLLPYARYSTNGKEWKKLASATEIPQEHVAYLIFLNDTDKGLKEFTLSEDVFSLNIAIQAKAEKVTIPDGNIWEGHTGNLIVDGNYETFTCLNRCQLASDKYVLDLGEVITLHDVRMCMGTVNGDHPNKAKIQYSENGAIWKDLNIMGTNTKEWTISTTQNVKYSNEMVYCDFEGANNKARFIRLTLTGARTDKWLRLYEIEVNRQFANQSTLPACKDGNNASIKELTDLNAQTGIKDNTNAPITFSFNKQYDIKSLTIYSIPTDVAMSISVTTDNAEWKTIGTLTEACQKIDLEAYPKALALRIEWTGDKAPQIYEMIAEYDTNTSSLPNEESELAQAFANLKALAQHALDSCGQGNKLITSNSQFSSPYTESKEGSLNNLLDGNQSTFWHSAWSAGSVQDGVHYLEIKLPEGTMGDVIMHYGRRSDTDGHHLIKANILGVVSGSGTSAQTEVVCELDMPYKSQTETIKRTFNLPKAYSAIRLLELRTSGDTKGVSAGFFHIGEMQIYDIQRYYVIKGAQAEANALIAAMAPLPSEATSEELKALQTAYDIFMYKVFGIVYDNIDEVQGTTPNNKVSSIYDLSGRRLHNPSDKGVYIVDGKKIIR